MNIILGWASPRLALDITYIPRVILKSKRGTGLGSQLLVLHGPSGPWGLQHSPEAATGL